MMLDDDRPLSSNDIMLEYEDRQMSQNNEYLEDDDREQYMRKNMYYDHELENRSRNIPIKGPTSNDETEVLEPNEDQYSFP